MQLVRETIRALAEASADMRRFMKYVRVSPDCWEWVGAKSGGYGSFGVEKRILRAHRFMWAAVNGAIPAGMCICHRCDNPACVNPGHLFLGTNHDNVMDRVAKGRSVVSEAFVRTSAPGERNRHAKLTEADVLRIRSLRGSHSTRQLMAMYGVTKTAINKIVNRTAWRHI